MARKLKPVAVLAQWHKFQKTQLDKPPKMRKAARQMSKIAKVYAAKCGMKSMGEVRCAADMQKQKIAFGYETKTLPYQYKPQKYTPDFELYGAKGKRIYIEYKGKLDKTTRKKLLTVKGCNPDLTLHLVFEKAKNKIYKGSKTTYAMWAEQHNFEWSEHFIKKEWLK